MHLHETNVIIECYDYAKVSRGEKDLTIECTDPAELELLIKQMAQYEPKLKLSPAKLPSGEVFCYTVENFANGKPPVNRYQMQYFVIRQLCHHGWEPLGIAGDVWGTQTQTYFHYQFRRKASAIQETP